MKAKITNRSVKAFHRGEIIFDTELRGFCARRLPSGRLSYGLKCVDAETGRQRWLGLGLHGDALPPEKARQRAEIERGRVADGKDPQSEREAKRRNRAEIGTLNALLDAHLTQHVCARKLRSADEIERCFDNYVRPELGGLTLPPEAWSQIMQKFFAILTEGVERFEGLVVQLAKPLFEGIGQNQVMSDFGAKKLVGVHGRGSSLNSLIYELLSILYYIELAPSTPW